LQFGSFLCRPLQNNKVKNKTKKKKKKINNEQANKKPKKITILKEIFKKSWFLIVRNLNLARIFFESPIDAHGKDTSLKNILLRAKIPPQP